MGDADGELVDGVGRSVQGDARAGPVLGSGGREDGKGDGGGGAGGGAVSPPQRAELLSGKRRNELCFVFCFPRWISPGGKCERDKT